MARPSAAEPWHPWKVHLPAALAGRVEYALFSPTYGKPIYGARSTLIASLLQRWIDSLPDDVRNEQGAGLAFISDLPENFSA